MKFGHQLRDRRLPKWTNRYIAYAQMKSMIKTIREQIDAASSSSSATPKQVKMFIDRLKSEIKKVDWFYVHKLQQMETRRTVITNRFGELPGLPASALAAAEISLDQALRICEQELLDLKQFAEINQVGFVKIAKKFDKQCPGGNVSSVLSSIVTTVSDLSVVDNLLQWCNESRDQLDHSEMPQSPVMQGLLQSIAAQSDVQGPLRSIGSTVDIATMMFHAIQKNNIEAVKELVPHIKDLNVVNPDGETFLSVACQYGFDVITKELLTVGASVSLPSRLDRTPLHVACIGKSANCVTELINAGANLNAKDVELHCPLHYGAILNDVDTCKELLDANAKTGCRDMNGNTALALAAMHGSLDVLELLIAGKARIDSFNWFGQIPLHLACRFGHLDCVRALLHAGSRIATYDVTGRSPLHEAARKGYDEILKMIIAAIPNQWEEGQAEPVYLSADVEGLTPLHSAAYYGRETSVKMLLEIGANSHARDRFGWTPRDYSLYCGHLELASLFPEPNDEDLTPTSRKEVSKARKYAESAPVHTEVPVEDEHIVVGEPHRHSSTARLSGSDISPTAACKVTFRVRARVQPQRYVCICGNQSFAGSWDPFRSIRMDQVDPTLLVDVPADVTDSTENELSTWTVTLYVPYSSRLEYKYLIMAQDVLEVWEVLPVNRVFEASMHAVNIIDDGFFGYQHGVDAGEMWTSQGWLVSDHQLHIRLGHVTGEKSKPCVRIFGLETPDLINVGYVAMGRKTTRHVPLPMQDVMENITFQIRPQKGELPEFCVVFDVFCGKGFRLGSGAVMSSALLMEGEGRTTIPLFGSASTNPVGECSFEFLVIRPFIHDNMKSVLGRCFSKSTKLIGHRGAGATKYYSKQVQAPRRLKTQENTILSFVTAATLGAEYIEFDVQLTRDLVPIIYHDWSFHLPNAKGIPPIPVSAITLEQFLTLRQRAHGRPLKTRDDVDLHKHHQRLSASSQSIALEIKDKYPLLSDCFKDVPEHVGFNVELKYPPDITQAEIGIKYASRNDYVDAVLKTVFDHAGSRRIIFSSFDPDICTITCLKQPSYPVFFLTEAGASPCWDPRGQSIREAIRFAKRQNLVGIVSYADPLLKAPKIITTIKATGLVLATWSSANNDVRNLEVSRKFGVDAIVVDRIAYVSEQLRKAAATP
ncbi:GP-PDE domain-containing protein [Plasmodiophora brassicae]